jgi:hypothetical protein
MILGRTGDVDQTISNAIARSPKDAPFIRDMINLYATQGRIPKALEMAKVLEKAQSDQWDVPYTIAKYELITGQRDAAYANIRKSVQLGGNAALQQIAREQLFAQVAQDPAFQAALRNQDPASVGTQGTIPGLFKASPSGSKK